MIIKNQPIAAVVLAAGKGVRMNCRGINKVIMPLLGRPMIAYTCDLLKRLKIRRTTIVTGFAQDSVKKILGSSYHYVYQKKRLGTAHAVECALEKIPYRFKEILVLNGDDSAFYRPRTISDLISRHRKTKADFTLLTIETADPVGLGRVLRSSDGKIRAIIEEKEASPEQRKINEVNPACYFFKRHFLEKYLSKVRKSPVSGEYYLTDLVRLGVENLEVVESFKVKGVAWRGINTWEELKEAEKMMRRFKNEN